ncbi:GNAT family N-acetyltransferase [Gordonia sp. ABSL49_1]|uniref:GNAT family N-acetyltransferase n=1 Tax=unclassified Gordonia (in: high G+C Gram-positive bacteria) TaxID=2657482 RepID=UPI001F100101|nr:GNAT family N-acetyltransferase [Gordonia sp. ABSL49_1]MCH5641521.1 GNAT family N-acetyltransferase [Gordonia sp. ABSL49_1]
MPTTEIVHARGPRVRLTDFAFDDLDAVHVIGSDPRVVEFTAWGPNTIDESRDVLNRAMAATEGRVLVATTTA